MEKANKTRAETVPETLIELTFLITYQRLQHCGNLPGDPLTGQRIIPWAFILFSFAKQKAVCVYM